MYWRRIAGELPWAMPRVGFESLLNLREERV